MEVKIQHAAAKKKIMLKVVLPISAILAIAGVCVLLLAYFTYNGNYIFPYVSNEPSEWYISGSKEFVPVYQYRCFDGIYLFDYNEDGTVRIVQYNGSRTDLMIPDEIGKKIVTRIGECAFYNRAVQIVHIPSTVTGLSSLAFYGAGMLRNIVFSGNHPNYVVSDNIIYSSDGTKLLCAVPNSGMETYQVPSTVTAVCDGAFAGQTSLVSIVIPDSVTSLGDHLFLCCSSLNNVRLPERLTEIPFDAFDSCSSLISLKIPDSVTVIKEYAFYGCDALKSLTLPPSLTEVGASAFAVCESLKLCVEPDLLNSDHYPWGLLEDQIFTRISE